MTMTNSPFVCTGLAAKKAAKFKGQIYNVGSGKQLSIKDAVDFARKNLGVRQKPKWGSMPSRIWDTNIWKSDCRKIKKDLEWRPKFSFEQGFIKTVRWLSQNKNYLEYYKKIIG